MEWEVRTITDVGLAKFNRDDGGVDEKIIVTIDPPIGKNGTTFVCNRTRERALCKATGSTKVNDWIGHTIAIRQGRSNFMGKDHKVVEVADVAPKSGNVSTSPKAPHLLGEDDNIPY